MIHLSKAERRYLVSHLRKYDSDVKLYIKILNPSNEAILRNYGNTSDVHCLIFNYRVKRFIRSLITGLRR